MIINLEQEEKELKAKIAELESKIAPLQKKLQEYREQLFHVEALKRAKNGGRNPLLPIPSWAEICKQHNWYTGGDSAHRVVRRQDPKLHASIPHECSYDARTYP